MGYIDQKEVIFDVKLEKIYDNVAKNLTKSQYVL